MAGMLSPYRVLDLTNQDGFFCGKILADLGADVIKIEPPGGDEARRHGPFYQNVPDPERSLTWFAFNPGKRGVTLDIRQEKGRELFRRMVPGADFVVESFSPGEMDRLGLGYDALCKMNPGIIFVSISPFGQNGPYRDYKGSDLVANAMGGFMNLTGDPDRAPLRVSQPWAFEMAAAQGAVGALMALYHRRKTGQGQLVDSSAQEGVSFSLLNALVLWDFNKFVTTRVGRFRTGLSGGGQQRQTWPCKDGAISFYIIGGGGAAKGNKALVEWMDSEGMASDFSRSVDWTTFDMASATQEFHERMEEDLGRFFMAHTKAEIYEGAIKRGIWLYPVGTPRDLKENPQLAARGFWIEVEHPELGRPLTYPGALACTSTIPVRPTRRAPLLGEHNDEVYLKEMGLSREELTALKDRGIV